MYFKLATFNLNLNKWYIVHFFVANTFFTRLIGRAVATEIELEKVDY